MPKVAITSLGCPRNLVDSEVILGILHKRGYAVTDPEHKPDILIINTCSFIQSAREESIQAILEALDLKASGGAGKVVVCGCLAQLYKDDTLKELPDVDAVFGTGDIDKIARYLDRIESGRRVGIISAEPKGLYSDLSPRRPLTPKHYSYIKLSEGCDNFCSYCIISSLRGRLRSRPLGSVLKEINKISSRDNTGEVIIIGQDTTVYGKDLYGRPMLAHLLEKAAGLKNPVEWIRLLYTHPAHYTDELIGAIADNPRICRYLDIPIQHISGRILKKMNRNVTKKDIITLLEKIRKKVPGIVLRTSLISGFPQETDADHRELAGFVKEGWFEKLGVFAYSREDGTPASRLPGQVPDEVKAARADELMNLQRKVSAGFTRRLVGRTLKVLIDEKVEGEKGEFVGRTEYDAPEIDGVIYVSGRGPIPGHFCRVLVTGSMEYDLIGEAK